MRKYGFIAAIVLSVLIAGGCGPGGGGVFELRNGGVEDGVTAPNYWFKTENGNTLAWDSDQFHSGNKSLRCTVNNASGANWGQGMWKAIPIGKKLTFSAWIKCDNLSGSGASIVIRCEDATHACIAFATTQGTTLINGTTDWVRYEVEKGVPDGTVSVWVFLCLLPNCTEGSVYFDDMSLVVSEVEV